MNNNEALVDFYRKVLATVRYTGDDNGAISKNIIGSDTRLPVAVSGKTLVLPTKAQLDHPDWSNRVVFHPMREDFSSGQSPVFENYRNELNFVFRVHTSFMFLNFANMAVADKEFQKSLPTEAASYLRAVKDGDAKFKKVIEDITSADASKYRNEMEFIRVSVQKNRKINGQVRKRVAMVSFPVLEKLLTHSKENKVTEVAGVPLRGIDRDMIIAMYKTVFPLSTTMAAYDTYSDSLQAPSMDALLRCAAALINCINTTAAPLIGLLPSMQEMIIPFNWKPILDDLDSYTAIFNSVPMLEGNVSTGHVVKNAAAIAAITVPAKDSMTPQQVHQQAQAEVANSDRNISVAPIPSSLPVVATNLAQPPVVQMGQAMQQMHHNVAPIAQLGMPVQQQQAHTTNTFKMDGPRSNTPAISHPSGGSPINLNGGASTTMMTPQQISSKLTPLMPEGAQQQAGLPGMPAGQPQLIQTAMGQVYLYPDGNMYSHAQLLQMTTAAQMQQAKDQQKKVQDLAATPAMQEILAVNPFAMQGMMPGQYLTPGVVPGMFGVQQPVNTRAAGTPYTPIGNVTPIQQVQPTQLFPQTHHSAISMPGTVNMGGAVYGMQQPNQGVAFAGAAMPQQPQIFMGPNGIPMMMGPNGMPVPVQGQMQMPMQMPGQYMVMPGQMQMPGQMPAGIGTGFGIPGF